MSAVKRREFIAGLGAVAWPAVVRAQQGERGRRIGLLVIPASNDQGFQATITAFREGLAKLGLVEGRNVEILYRHAEAHYDRLPALAADLVSRRVDVVVAAGPIVALAAKSATATIPIVFLTGSDPVELGLVESLNRPGGNATGVSFLIEELTAKRLELLHEIVPTATSIGFLNNPTLPLVEVEIRKAQNAAHILGLRLVIANASTPSEIDTAFESLAAQRIRALLTANDQLFSIQRDQLAALAARHAVPAMYYNRENPEAGGLMSYGANILDAYRLAGTYIDRIVKGEKPADLPVQQSTRIEMVLNLKTAKALGLTVPQSILLLADEVID